MRQRVFVGLGIAIVCASATLADGPNREEKVRSDKARVEAGKWWIYQDLAKGLDEAKSSGKPVVVVLRCVPCENCVKLDDESVDQDPRVRPLLEQFVRVRLVGTNGLDLSTFQFDTDQSWLVFFLRADGTVYGRFGTRSDHQAWADDVSVEGLAKALEGALALHKAFPREREALAAKRGPAPAFPTPEAYPDLKAKYGPLLDFGGKVVPSCIHCHQIGDADRAYRLSQGRGLADETLFPFPHPRTVGLVLDPKERALVKAVADGSAAKAAGFEAGDVIERLGGQPLLSIADVQWVLQGVPATGGEVPAEVRRGAATRTLALRLADGWRRADDISWRVSTWALRRLALGGMKLDALSAAERTAAGLPADALGLRVAHVGQNAPHDAAKQAGIQKGDVLLAFDGRRDLVRETDLIRYALNEHKAGTKVTVALRRGQQDLEVSLSLAR